MIVRRCLTLAVAICLILSVKFDVAEGERWSRQVSNSEWIPLANPRATQAQVEQSSPATGLLATGNAQLPQLPQLSLPPALQQQYQEQLLQLQKTQENIQKLLLLQQQLRAQQQLLQSQTFLPSGFSNADEDKRLHEVGLGGPQVADVSSEDLVPPLPASEALPPVFPAQNFLGQRSRHHPPTKQDASLPQEVSFVSLSGQDFKNGQLLQPGEQNVGNVEQIEENQRQGAKQIKEPGQASLVPQGESGQNEEEEVQLVYVPAETLAQRGQPKRGRGRKQYPLRQQQQQQQQQQPQQPQQHHDSRGIDDQDALARQILQQIQLEREEKAQFLKEERMKEIVRLNEEQKSLERKARLQQEALQREQELQRQREIEKKKKELEKLEELAKQRELERIREAREKQRVEELERRRLGEIRAKEEKRRAEEAAEQREMERLAALEKQKELEFLKEREKQRENNEARLAESERTENQDVQAQALPLIRDQFHRQHPSETPKQSKSKVRSRQRQRVHYQDQQNYRETTTPSPNQPPLAVYMGSSSTKTSNVKVADVLRILKDAKTIAVLDTVGPDTPQVFVGPTSLDPPTGYAKFDLPYLSSIDHNRVERKVDKLPFFVAPLSFDPPPGYSKIPFPAPHIGSVVVNTLDNADPKGSDDHNPSPTPLIEPNSYLDGLDSVSESTTPSYEPQTTINYSPESSSTPRYEQTYSPTSSAGYSGSRFRFRQFYGDGKPATVVSSYYDDQRPTTRKQKYYDESSSRTTEAPVQSPKVETSVSRAEEEISYSTTPSFREETIGQQEESGQLALINQQLAQQRVKQRYNNGGQYSQQNPQASTGLVGSFDGEITAGDVNEVRAPVGPTQYSLPAELPAISPHLPGLVNSLLDKNEVKLHPAATTTTSTTSTTTTTTTQRTPTTTYRPRSRQRSRLVSTRARTTTEAPSTKSNVDKNRRPYNRSRSRFTTTTEEYRESAYEPTKSKIPETTLRYNSEHRRPTSRTNKYRNRDKTSQQPEVVGHAQNLQAQQPYDAGSPINDSNSPITDSGSSVHRQLDSSSSLNDHAPENYPPTTVSATENYPSFHDVTVNHATALISDDYSRSQNYPQNVQDGPRYRPGYDESTLERTDLERNPVNGFNYQAQSGESLDQEVVQRPKNYQLDGKAENSDFELATTVDPRLRTPDEQRYSQIYEVNVPQNQPEYSLTGQDNLHRVESDKIQAGVDEDNPNERPIFIPLPENKQEDYELPVSPTEVSLSDVTTEAITTSTTPVVIRQRVRGRVGTRLHHEPSIQTRNKGSQDEYVRFNVVSQDSARTVPSRQRARTRPRTQNHGSQVQTDGNEYIKIHAVQQQRQIVGATKSPAPSTTTTTVRPTEEDVDYGFIRPPNFRPAHPVDNRFQTPVTYRPQLLEVPQQSLLANDETAVESNPPQTHLPKNRQKYQPAPNRRLPLKPTTLPPLTTTPEIVTTTERIPVATMLPEDTTYTGRSKSRPDETKQTRTKGRIRRPGRKRVTTTSTTESVLEAHNELPLDENYPLIRPQSVTAEQQQSPYDENYENAGGFPDGARNPTSEHQFYDASSENYPPEFILNFGNYPAQPVQREEYDQTQLASSSAKKYSQASRTRPSEDDRQTTADIYGSESQWSTKLTRTSFQPSFAVNQVPEEAPKSNQRFHESLKNANPPEIITAAPEVASVTLVVSSDDRMAENTQREENETMLMGTTIFGRKTIVQDHTEKLNASETGTTAPEAKEKSNSEADVDQNGDPWLVDKAKDSTEQQNIDLEKIVRKNDNSTSPVGKKTTRRRRVRVRVRPAVDDFVTAESQHLNSALNGLFRDQYKYNPVRESKPSAVGSTSPGKSILQDFLSDILKSGESTKITTTEVPEVAWTMSPAATTPMAIPGDIDETTEIQITTIPYTYSVEETTVTVPPDDLFTKLKPRDDTRANEQEKKERNEKKTASVEKETWESTKKQSQKTTINFGSINDKYKTSGNDASKSNGELNDSEAPRGIDQKESEGKNDVAEDRSEIDKESASEFEERNKESMDENSSHPKNHRVKWSEVRYPFAFDHSKPSSWNYDPKTSGRSATTSIPGFVTRNEGDGSVKTLSDYVQAIFDTMKSAEEETTVANTENPDEIATTVLPVFNTEIPDRVNRSGEEKSAVDGGAFKLKDDKVETTTRMSFEESETTTNLYENGGKEATLDTESTTDVPLKNVTTLERIEPTSHATTNPLSEDYSATDPLLTTTPKPSGTALLTNSTESILGKVLRTSTTTKVSHMTEICYRGRCVMTRPSRDDRLR